MGSRADDRAFIAALRERVNAWDPLALIAAGAPADEYDCLLGLLTHGLRDGISADALSDLVKARLAEHFGSLPLLTNTVDGFASEIRDWYRREYAATPLG